MRSITQVMANTTLAFTLVGGAAANTAPFPIAGGGSTYLSSLIGPWTDEDCIHFDSLDLELEDLLLGRSDETSCLLEDARFADSSAQVALLLTDDGFTATFGGAGHAEGAETFNRHDVVTNFELGFPADTRLRIDWTMEAGGLGSAWFQMQRLGDIGGELDASPPSIDHGVGAYATPLLEQGHDVLFIPAGRWHLRLHSNHQASGGWEEGFRQSWGGSTHAATIVALGDVDGDETVGVADLLTVIGRWGAVDADDSESKRADLDGDETVGAADLLRVISDWG
ncbi:MAG TPA: hypothetical protein DEO57_07660 [Phycisphaerales bacterium]|nr:hypothetical protein [Phycisphaerales bacterium]